MISNTQQAYQISRKRQEKNKKNVFSKSKYYSTAYESDRTGGLVSKEIACTTDPNTRVFVGFEEDPARLFTERGGKNKTKLVDHLLWYANRFRNMYLSQRTIAIAIGCSLRTVGRILNKLSEYGLVFKRYRHNETSLYRISSIFLKKKIKEMLSFYLKNIGLYLYGNNVVDNLSTPNDLPIKYLRRFINFYNNFSLDYGRCSYLRFYKEIVSAPKNLKEIHNGTLKRQNQ